MDLHEIELKVFDTKAKVGFLRKTYSLMVEPAGEMGDDIYSSMLLLDDIRNDLQTIQDMLNKERFREKNTAPVG